MVDKPVEEKRTRVPVLSAFVDLIYGSLPAPTFQLPDGRLQPDFLMDTVPDILFVVVSLTLVLMVSFVYGERRALLECSLIPVLIHWFLFIAHGLPARSEKFFDLAGQLGISSMLAYSLVYMEKRSTRSYVVCTLVLLWSLRLGYFLFSRFLERGEDWRFIRARNYPGFHFFTWTCQGLWCFLQAHAVLALNHVNGPMGESHAFGSSMDYLGIFLWGIGLFIEAKADSQKLNFVRKYPFRQTRLWIDEGLWRYSRHPNFFGETLHWVGISVLCFAEIDTNSTAKYMCLFAPIFSAIFLMQTTVPWLDLLADEKYAGNRYYENYCASVSSYVLLPRRPIWL